MCCRVGVDHQCRLGAVNQKVAKIKNNHMHGIDDDDVAESYSCHRLGALPVLPPCNPFSSLLSTMTSTLPPLIQAFSGAIGSASANSLVYPLDLVTTRLQTSRSKYSGLSRAIYILHSIIDKHGWLALYDGLDTDTAATLLSK